KGISTLQKDFKFSIKEKLNELDMYIDDKFEEFDSDQEYFRDIFNNIKTDLEEQFNVLFEQKINDNLNSKFTKFNEQTEVLTKNNVKGLECSDILKQQKSVLESLSDKLGSIKNLTPEILNKSIEDSSEKFTKNTNKVIGNFINLNKETKNFLSDLKAAIILLESSKTPLQNKLATQDVEIKTLQKNITELKKENQDLLNKIEKLEIREE
ncbi:unnamed protein product, partial [marine sediment metagenome]